MGTHKLRLAALAARTRRMLKHTDNPVERALALVVIARTVADYAATKAAVGPKRTIHGAAGIAEVRGTERILNAALQHLQDLRTDSYTNAEPDRQNQP
ncbi:hypothetical protein NY542_00120 [Curtobacterium flaccumfaciens pv. betae]|uniref:hypothetical protein n=1 Tax=Curtobacterium flaccumfaciens TaxID=2035 RepID=UPI001BDF5494|nr:hypothetical protein [Curtobacterium flaccumfaciens]MBT1608491.1 hypothetical protein [Curtobacterium flaccumfaciens pv. betae]MBT1633281.1 hypothetical protein [Curtobacterium flaccumfaciens pv. oortii]MBT1657375.1 hypothetical protein [Curtobacterium flaccumfaciens pv. betae]MCS5465607.1 hypothetical protein [Curtobacterium flaccumfaciens pv. betae]MCX2846928.1 hypothetical protein [Curtobacterium flaccumfaciens pv. oortii]